MYRGKRVECTEGDRFNVRGSLIMMDLLTSNKKFVQFLTKGQLILKCPFGVSQKTNEIFSRIKRSNQKNKGTSYH